MLAAIAAGAASIVCTLPFMKAASQFHAHYYNLANTRPGYIGFAYVQMLNQSASVARHQGLFLALLAALALALSIQFRRNRNASIASSDAVFLALLAALPVFGFLLARFVTHTIEPRYVLGAIIGLSALLAIGAASIPVPVRIANIALGVLFAAMLLNGFWRVHHERGSRQQILLPLTPSPALAAALSHNPNAPIYFQGSVRFAFVNLYEPDAQLQSRMVLLYSRDQELRCGSGDTEFLIETNASHYTHLRMEAYESVASQPGDRLFLVYKGAPENWIDCALSNAHSEITDLGPALGGELESVRFRP